MRRVRLTHLMTIAVGLIISEIHRSIAHAQTLFTSEADFNVWTGNTTVNPTFEPSSGPAYNGLASGALVGPGAMGTAGSIALTIPAGQYFAEGISQNFIDNLDADYALGGADYIQADISTLPTNISDATLVVNFDGSDGGEFVETASSVVSQGSYSTATFPDPFIYTNSMSPASETYLQIGCDLNSTSNDTSTTVSLANIRVVAPAWTITTSGDWNTSGNWTTADTGMSPNYQGLEADFLGYVISNTTVNTATTVNIGTILLNDSANSYTLSATGAGNITMNMPGVEPALINDAAGSHLISAPVNLASTTCVNVVGAGDTLTISGAIAGTGGLDINEAGTLGLQDSGAMGTLAAPSIGVSAVVNGVGTVKLTSASNTYGGGTTIQSGTLIAAVTGALPSGTHVVNNGNLVVNGNATLGSLNGTGTLALSPASGATTVTLANNSGLATLGGLTIAANSSLDITNNHFILSYLPGTQAAVDASVRSYIISGRNGGAWNGATGIKSSVAALPANSHYAIGYADGADHVVAGLSSGQIEVKYTLLGDADLDGSVTGSDFTALVGNLGKSGRVWDQGDFDYDGSVTGSDFTDLVGNLGKSASGADVVLPAADYAAIDAFAAANGLMADVPEPASAGILLATGIGFMARRRRSSK
jgi:autotransporter-associated beta strand protein